MDGESAGEVGARCELSRACAMTIYLRIPFSIFIGRRQYVAMDISRSPSPIDAPETHRSVATAETLASLFRGPIRSLTELKVFAGALCEAGIGFEEADSSVLVSLLRGRPRGGDADENAKPRGILAAVLL